LLARRRRSSNQSCQAKLRPRSAIPALCTCRPNQSPPARWHRGYGAATVTLRYPEGCPPMPNLQMLSSTLRTAPPMVQSSGVSDLKQRVSVSPNLKSKQGRHTDNTITVAPHCCEPRAFIYHLSVIVALLLPGPCHSCNTSGPGSNTSGHDSTTPGPANERPLCCPLTLHAHSNTLPPDPICFMGCRR